MFIAAAALFALSGLLAGGQTALAGEGGVCMVERFNATKPANTTSLNCTSNDVRLAEYTLLTGPDSCVVGEEITVTLQGEFVATSAERWDVGVFIHEIGHQWLTRVHFKQGGRSNSDIEDGGSHWSFTTDTDGSFMQGNDIRDNDTTNIDNSQDNDITNVTQDIDTTVDVVETNTTTVEHSAVGGDVGNTTDTDTTAVTDDASDVIDG